MANTSLGTLTLDLAVRLSEFTDGLSRAERETRDSTENMGESVGKFKEKLIDDLSGTAIGDAVGSLNEKLSSITDAFGEGGLAGAAAIGAASIIGSVAAIGVGLVTLALQTAEADEQLERLATRANTSTTNLQVLTAATGAYGLEMESVGDILADAQEKLGEFSATGGGGLVDTLELMQNATKKTDAELEIFGKSLSTMDSVDAIQAVVNEMEQAGATTQEVRFVTESLASGLGDIIPLWDNNGEALRNYEHDLNEAGVIRTKESIEQSQLLANEVEGLQIKFEGVSNQLVTAALPAMATLIEYFKEGTTQGGSFKNEISGVGQAINITAASVVGLAAGMGLLINSFSAVGRQMANIGQTAQNFYNADNLADKGKALFTGFFSAGALASGSMLDISSQWARDMETITKLLDGASGKMNKINTQRPTANTSFGSVLTPKGNNAAFPYRNDGIPYRTGAIDVEIIASRAMADAAEEEAKAQEKLAKANDKTAKSLKGLATVKLSVNAKALNNAENYGFANYEAQYGLPQGLMTGIHMQESHGNTKATGPSTKWGTAKGGFQLIDATAKRFQVDNAYNMEQATEGAAKYLSYLYKHFNGDLAKTIAAYNTGEGNVDNNPMSLILSDRWARNKKTGIGQTKEYTKNVLAYMKSATTDTSKLVYDTVSKQAQDAQKLQEDTLKRQQSIQVKYATAREKLDRDYVADITEIESLYAEGSLERTDLLNRAKTEYEEKRQAKAKSILETYMSDEVKLGYEHNKKIDAINAEFAHDDTTREMLIDLQKSAYQEDLDNFRFASQAKAREQDKMYQSLANSMKANGLSAAGTGLDAMAQRTMSGQDYEVWRLAQDHDEAYDSVNNQYADRQKEINEKDERGEEYLLPELERNELLELARQEHLDSMWAMEQEYALKEQTLAEQQTSQKIAMYQSLFSGITGLTKAFAGEQSTAYRIVFGIEQGFAIAQAAMAIQQSIAKAMTIGYPKNIPIIAEVVGQGAQIVSNIKNITMGGIAHGGLDYVPKEATYLLDKGERVLSPRQNKDLANFMANGQKSNTSDVNINVNVDAKGNGQMTGDTSNALGRKMAEGMKQVAKSVIIQEKRQGGLLYGT